LIISNIGRRKTKRVGGRDKIKKRDKWEEYMNERDDR
jgi:hypothetical protein